MNGRLIREPHTNLLDATTRDGGIFPRLGPNTILGFGKFALLMCTSALLMFTSALLMFTSALLMCTSCGSLLGQVVEKFFQGAALVGRGRQSLGSPRELSRLPLVV